MGKIQLPDVSPLPLQWSVQHQILGGNCCCPFSSCVPVLAYCSGGTHTLVLNLDFASHHFLPVACLLNACQFITRAKCSLLCSSDASEDLSLSPSSLSVGLVTGSNCYQTVPSSTEGALLLGVSSHRHKSRKSESISRLPLSCRVLSSTVLWCVER